MKRCRNASPRNVRLANLTRLRERLLSAFLWIVAVSGIAVSSHLPAQAADEVVMRFRRDPRTQSQVVKLGDLVEITAGTYQLGNDILSLPLAPAPRSGARQEWTAADVLKHLELRGLSQKSIRWSGPETTTLLHIEPVVEPEQSERLSPAYVDQRLISQAQTNVAQAIREYLWLKTGERTTWRISVVVPPEHAQGLLSRRSIEAVGGGEEPWEGKQTFTLSYKSQNKSIKATFDAELALPTMVVVAVRPIRPDEVLDASMLKYSPINERSESKQGEYFTDMEAVLSKQMRRSVSTGLPIVRSAIGEPIVVSSGEFVTIEAVAGGVSVKTAGRALSGGATGDAINVEIISSRKKITALVVGPKQVQLAVQANAVANSPVANRQVTSNPVANLPVTNSPVEPTSRAASADPRLERQPTTESLTRTATSGAVLLSPLR